MVKGVRRIGKSSLIRVGLKLFGVRLYAVFDARLASVPSVDALYEVIAEGLEGLLRRAPRGLASRIAGLLSRVEGVSVAGFSVELRERSPTVIVRVAEALNRVAEETREPVVLVFDEAQEFSIVPKFAGLLARIYDYHHNVKLVLAGSEVGLLDRLLGRENPRSPLYGRPYLEIVMRRLSRGESIDFLERGFAELGVDWPRENVEEAVDKLDGIPGWLTAYGYYAYTLGSHEKALARVLEEGVATARRELERFLSNRAPARTRYLAILRCLRLRPMRWSELKRCMELEVGRRLNNAQFTRYLRELQDYSIVEKTVEGEYRIADPLMAEAVAAMR